MVVGLGYYFQGAAIYPEGGPLVKILQVDPLQASTPSPRAPLTMEQWIYLIVIIIDY